MAAIVALTQQRERAFSPSVVYLAIGAAGAVGTAVLDVAWLDLVDDADVVERLAEVAVIVALFAPGMRLDRPIGWWRWRSTILLLAIVMPITIAAVAAFGVVAMGLSAGVAIALGAASPPPTPCSRATSASAPRRGGRAGDQLRADLGGGLNDGLAFPFIYLGLVVAAGAGAGDIVEWVAVDVVYATVAGIAIGVLGGRRSPPSPRGCASAACWRSSWTGGRRSAPCSPSTDSRRSPGHTGSSPPSRVASPSAAARGTTSTTAASTPAP
jgi:sodium/hydrogen antiporter